MKCKYCGEKINIFDFIFDWATCFGCSLVEKEADKQVRKELGVNYRDWSKDKQKRISAIKEKLKPKYKKYVK